MGKYFGTDGFRGEANVNLTVEHAYKVGRFLGWYYGQRAKKTADNPEGRCRVAIGKDTRLLLARMFICFMSPPPRVYPMWCARKSSTAAS